METTDPSEKVDLLVELDSVGLLLDSLKSSESLTFDTFKLTLALEKLETIVRKVVRKL